jgi:hypothetical protein
MASYAFLLLLSQYKGSEKHEKKNQTDLFIHPDTSFWIKVKTF